MHCSLTGVPNLSTTNVHSRTRSVSSGMLQKPKVVKGDEKCELSTQDRICRRNLKKIMRRFTKIANKSRRLINKILLLKVVLTIYIAQMRSTLFSLRHIKSIILYFQPKNQSSRYTSCNFKKKVDNFSQKEQDMKHILAFHPAKIFRWFIVNIFFTQINRSQLISGIAPDTYSILEYHSVKKEQKHKLVT